MVFLRINGYNRLSLQEISEKKLLMRASMSLVSEDLLVLEEVHVLEYERVVKISDKDSGLRAIICIHNTTLGPALGGTRIYPYSSWEDALYDVKRLAKGMTYKSALAQTGLGGGKSVILADPKKEKTKERLRAFGRAVHLLGGGYICAEDVGSSTEDMEFIREETPYVVGLARSTSSGDPSPFTAWGTLRGIQAALKSIYGCESIQGKTVAIQGLGHVGAKLAELLFWMGAKLIVADIDSKRATEIGKNFSAAVCSSEEIYTAVCDVFAPCALGGILNAKTIPTLRCKAVAGCANNQLGQDSDAEVLLARNILYAPDFVINAGGLINVTQELEASGYVAETSRKKVDAIFDQLNIIFDIAKRKRCSTHGAATDLGNYQLRYQIGKRTQPLCFHH